ncbi:MAG: AsnC family transcriptional regulator [archaeon]
MPPMEELDIKDRQIIWNLTVNSRQSFAKIAKKVKLSKEAVNYRVKRLTEKKIIRGYYALIDPSALGLMSARFFIKFQHATPKIEKELIEYYTKNPQTGWTVSRGGEYDFGAQFWGKNISELYREKKEMLDRFRPYIKEVSLGIYHKIHFFDRKYLIGNKKETLHATLCASEKVEVDELDLRILTTISADARLSIPEIAQKLNEHPHIINYRLKKLNGPVIKGFLLMADWEKIGCTWSKITLTLDEYKEIDKIINFCSSHSKVTSAYEMLNGGGDLEIEIETKSREELREFLEELMEKFTSSIRYYDYFDWAKEHKAIFMPLVELEKNKTS